MARSSGPEIGVPLHFVQNTDHDQVVLTIRADEAEAMTETVTT